MIITSDNGCNPTVSIRRDGETIRHSVAAGELYCGENGMLLCGKHLGATATLTGLDLDDEMIEIVTPQMIREWKAQDAKAGFHTDNFSLNCESRGCKASKS